MSIACQKAAAAAQSPCSDNRWSACRWMVLVVLLLAGCQQPTLNAVHPSDGYPRQLLAVEGTTAFARVVWDVGLPTEVELQNGLFATSYFQIPEGAIAGDHPVAIRNSQGTSASFNVTVLEPSGQFPAPRIKDFGVLGMNEVGGGNVDLLLTVSGANLDVDANVMVNGAPVEAWRWGGLPVDFLQAHVPATFGYPIYHYVQMLCLVENVALGSSLNVRVTNTDGASDSGSYTLPATMAELDSDGDGLLDVWEENGYTAASGGTIDLPAMGANKSRKTILVEVDWIATAAPNAATWPGIEQVFADAPVLNPNGSSGIDILIDRGQGGAFTEGGDILANHTTMDFGPSSAAGYVDFFDYKDANFNPDRLNIFRYGIFGRVRPTGSSGRGEVWGNDFMVTFTTFAVWPQTIAQVGTFVHELGHTLGLTHGNNNTTPAQWNEAWKPNFPTTMSYRYQFPGVSIDCDWVSDGGHTFSQGMFATIDESFVDENIGICDTMPLDMNEDGAITAGPMDTSRDGDMTDIHDDFDQWHDLLFKFDLPGSRWLNN